MFCYALGVDVNMCAYVYWIRHFIYMLLLNGILVNFLTSGADTSCHISLYLCCQSNATWLLPKGHGTACVLLILCYLRRASCALEEDWWLAVWCRMFTVIAVSEVSMSDLCLLNTGSPFYTFRCWLLFAFGVFDFAQVGGHVAVWRAPWVTSVQQGIVFTWVDTKYIWLIYIEMEEVEEAGKFHNFILTTLRHKWETLYFKNVKF